MLWATPRRSRTFGSLAIEEQFYLIWPPLLFAMVSMHVSKPNTRRVVLGLAAVSALAMMLLYNPAADPQPRVLRHRHPRVLAAAGSPGWPLSPIATWRRCVSLIVWGSIAWLAPPSTARTPRASLARRPTKQPRPPRHSRAPSCAFGPRPHPSMCWASWVWLALPPWSRSPTATPRSSIAAARCYVPSSRSWSSRPCVQPQGMVARALSTEPLVWVGKRSYSIYLWHYPLLLLMNPVANINDTPLVAVHLAGVVGDRRGRMFVSLYRDAV